MSSPGDLSRPHDDEKRAGRMKVERETSEPIIKSDEIALQIHHSMRIEWLSNTAAVYVLVGATIISGLLAAFGEENVRMAAVQILGVIVGAAAGALWQGQRRKE